MSDIMKMKRRRSDELCSSPATNTTGRISKLLVLVMSHALICSAEFIPFGVQMGNQDEARSTYVKSMSLNPENLELTIAGTTYGNYFSPDKAPSASNYYNTDCFLGIFHLPHFEEGQSNRIKDDELSWIRRRQFGGEQTSESCEGLKVGPDGRALLLAQSIGNNREKGDQGGSKISDTIHTSMVLEYNNVAELVGGSFDYEHSVEYLSAITSSKDFENFFVASRIDNTIHDEAINLERSKRAKQRGRNPANVNTVHSNLDGSDSVRLKRLYSTSEDQRNSSVENDKTGIKETLSTRWIKEFHLDSSSHVAEVTAIEYLSPVSLIMAGHTTGAGEAFGYPASSESTSQENNGFVTAIHPYNGNISTVKRIETVGSVGDVKIWGMCAPKNQDASFIIIVGETTGILDAESLSSAKSIRDKGRAFAARLDAETLDFEWIRHFGVEIPDLDSSIEHEALSSFVSGVDCEVTPDGDHVYIAGQTRKGARLVAGEQTYESMGGDDIFIAQFEASFGIFQFAKQFGSSQDDWLARGKALGVDSEGNLILVGNTRGSFFRERNNTRVVDAFAMTVSRSNGDTVQTVENLSKTSSSVGADGATLSDKNDSVDTKATENPKEDALADRKPTPTAPPYTFEETVYAPEASPIMELSLICLSLSLSCMLIVMMCYKRQKRLYKQRFKKYIYEYEDYGMAPLEEYSDDSTVDAIAGWSQQLVPYYGPNNFAGGHDAHTSTIERRSLITQDESSPDLCDIKYDKDESGQMQFSRTPRVQSDASSIGSYLDGWMDRTRHSFSSAATQIVSNLHPSSSKREDKNEGESLASF